MPAFDRVRLPTSRLLLRPLQPVDAPFVLALFSDAGFMKFGTTAPFVSIDEADALIERDRRAMAAGERIRLGIERVADGSLIGICTLFDLDAQSRKAEIGYGLLTHALGQGYMHEALLALLAYGFLELGLNRVQAEIDPDNIDSARSLQRLGFVKEGQLRESCVVNGVVCDCALFGLLRRDWKQPA
jgi:RimJ/RimL family protein N-acetyltransferase